MKKENIINSLIKDKFYNGDLFSININIEKDHSYIISFYSYFNGEELDDYVEVSNKMQLVKDDILFNIVIENILDKINNFLN